jgi:hypothetical protein
MSDHFPGYGTKTGWNFEGPAKFVGMEKKKLEKFRDIHDEIKKSN